MGILWNLWENGLETPLLLKVACWNSIGWYLFQLDIHLRSNDSCVKLSGQMSISQKVIVNQTEARPIIVSAWSRALNVNTIASSKDYSVYIDVQFLGWDLVHNFFCANHSRWDEWVGPCNAIWKWNLQLAQKMESVSVWAANWISAHSMPNEVSWRLCMVWRNRSVGAGKLWACILHYCWLTDLCDLKSQRDFLVIEHQPPLGIANQRAVSVVERNRAKLSFFVIWTTAANTWRLRHRRVLESVLFHHPEATITMYSNTYWFF